MTAKLPQPAPTDHKPAPPPPPPPPPRHEGHAPDLGSGHLFLTALVKHVSELKAGHDCATACTQRTVHYTLRSLGSWLFYGPGSQPDRFDALATLLERHAAETGKGWWEREIPVVVVGQGTSQRSLMADDLNIKE